MLSTGKGWKLECLREREGCEIEGLEDNLKLKGFGLELKIIPPLGTKEVDGFLVSVLLLLLLLLD